MLALVVETLALGGFVGPVAGDCAPGRGMCVFPRLGVPNAPPSTAPLGQNQPFAPLAPLPLLEMEPCAPVVVVADPVPVPALALCRVVVEAPVHVARNYDTPHTARL